MCTMAIADRRWKRRGVQRLREAGQIRAGPKLVDHTPAPLLQSGARGNDRRGFSLGERDRDLRGHGLTRWVGDNRGVLARLAQDQLRDPIAVGLLHRRQHGRSGQSPEQLPVTQHERLSARHNEELLPNGRDVGLGRLSTGLDREPAGGHQLPHRGRPYHERLVTSTLRCFKKRNKRVEVTGTAKGASGQDTHGTRGYRSGCPKPDLVWHFAGVGYRFLIDEVLARTHARSRRDSRGRRLVRT